MDDLQALSDVDGLPINTHVVIALENYVDAKKIIENKEDISKAIENVINKALEKIDIERSPKKDAKRRQSENHIEKP
ncbi:MAG: hypothetical protein WCP92_10185 [bacterium]